MDDAGDESDDGGESDAVAEGDPSDSLADKLDQLEKVNDPKIIRARLDVEVDHQWRILQGGKVIARISAIKDKLLYCHCYMHKESVCRCNLQMKRSDLSELESQLVKWAVHGLICDAEHHKELAQVKQEAYSAKAAAKSGK